MIPDFARNVESIDTFDGRLVRGAGDVAKREYRRFIVGHEIAPGVLHSPFSLFAWATRRLIASVGDWIIEAD